MNKFRKYARHIIPFLFILTIPLLGVLYSLTDNSEHNVHSLTTLLDYNTPYLKIFILPYIAWYPYLLVSYIFLCISDRKAYYVTLTSYNVCLIVSNIIFFCYQTTVPRPINIGHDWLNNIVSWVYQHDRPFDCFPSIHVIGCYLVMKGVCHSQIRQRIARLIIYLVGTTIIVSTLFVKQHVLFDVIGGILIVEVVFLIISMIYTRMRTSKFKWRTHQGDRQNRYKNSRKQFG
ncbi:PAP2 superfamily protein [Paenibacillus sp. yr247]|uniref:phosphatase PAP2 family protein n=1 Tax=Paenibacillus sp. yr247 TaxID=1761880 RepID=UPI00087FD01E|nr:PAP2 superfamily protein [Paenibacillus sp. yr247]